MITEVTPSKEELAINPFLKYINYSDKGVIKYSLIYNKIDIEDIEVKEEYRNQGIASEMMEYIINIAKKEKVINITLEVKETNEAAIHLYEKYGFRPVAKREKYYDGVDGVLMILEMM